MSPKPKEFKVSEYEALKFRWGFCDKSFHTIKETVNSQRVDAQAFFELDKLFFERLGFFTKLTERQKQKWMKC